MSLEHILLGMLRQPASGYQLKREFNEGARYFWSAELSQIYPALHQLEKRGLLASRRQASDKGPPRKVYRRTAAGTRALHRWIRQGPQVGAERFAYIGQLIFMGELDDLPMSLQFMQQLRVELKRVHQVLSDAEADVNRAFPQGPETMDSETFHTWLSVRMGVVSLGAKVEWCDQAEQSIRKRLASQSRPLDKQRC